MKYLWSSSALSIGKNSSADRAAPDHLKVLWFIGLRSAEDVELSSCQKGRMSETGFEKELNIFQIKISKRTSIWT